MCVLPIALQFGSRTALRLYLYVTNICRNSILYNEVILLNVDKPDASISLFAKPITHRIIGFLMYANSASFMDVIIHEI